MRLMRPCFAILTLLVSISANAAPVLRSGDRVVFLGDSITEQRLYTRYVMDYFALRYPDMRITFRNAGWSGDTAPGGLKRLERDVLSLRPTVVTICFGMNDGGVTTFDPAIYKRYMDGMSGLVSALKKAGARVVLLTPGCVDPDRKNWNSPERMRVYNPTLTRLAQGVQLLAERERLPVYDINALMLEVQARAKAEDPAFTMIPDGVHPDAKGHVLMAYGLLKALGCDEPPSALRLDAATRRAAADRCHVSDLRVTGDAVIFTRTDDALPTWFDPAADPILKLFPAAVEMNRYPLAVTGLKPGSWRLSVDGTDLGEFTSEELAAGIDLSSRPGPWRKLAEQVNALSKDQESLYFTRWREVSFSDKLTPAERARKLAELDRSIAEKESARQEAVRHRTWKWILAFVR